MLSRVQSLWRHQSNLLPQSLQHAQHVVRRLAVQDGCEEIHARRHGGTSPLSAGKRSRVRWTSALLGLTMCRLDTALVPGGTSPKLTQGMSANFFSVSVASSGAAGCTFRSLGATSSSTAARVSGASTVYSDHRWSRERRSWAVGAGCRAAGSTHQASEVGKCA
jgi:hypothetical protein